MVRSSVRDSGPAPRRDRQWRAV